MACCFQPRVLETRALAQACHENQARCSPQVNASSQAQAKHLQEGVRPSKDGQIGTKVINPILLPSQQSKWDGGLRFSNPGHDPDGLQRDSADQSRSGSKQKQFMDGKSQANAPESPGYQTVQVTRAELMVAHAAPHTMQPAPDVRHSSSGSRDSGWRPSNRGAVHPEPTGCRAAASRLGLSPDPGGRISSSGLAAHDPAQPRAQSGGVYPSAQAQVEAMWQPPRRPGGSAPDVDGNTYITAGVHPGQLVSRQASDTSYFKGSTGRVSNSGRGQRGNMPEWLGVLASTVGGKKSSHTEGVGLSARSREVSGGMPSRLSDAYKQRVVSARSSEGREGTRALSATASENGSHAVKYGPPACGLRTPAKPATDSGLPSTPAFSSESGSKRTSRRSPGPGAAGFLGSLLASQTGDAPAPATSPKGALAATRQALANAVPSSKPAYSPGLIARLQQQQDPAASAP